MPAKKTKEVIYKHADLPQFDSSAMHIEIEGLAVEINVKAPDEVVLLPV